ncbi:MAG: transporter substrate-binding domain-containing protein [Alphaproteobacteria bacterium]|nr:transporter substrate-binding domain-containing protein [Alphaproteobacteria bacterium]
MRSLWIAMMAALLALPVPSARAEIWTIACDDNFAPYNFFEGKALVGIDIDLVTALVRQAGAEPRFEAMAWNRVRDKLERDQVDAAFQFVGLPERFEKYHMIGPYRTGRTVFAVQRNTPASFDRYDDLQRYIIGLVNGFSYGVPFDTDPSLRKDSTAGDNRQLLRMLSAGRVTLAIGDERTLLHIIRKEQLQDQITFLPRAFNEIERYIAVPRSRPQIAARLELALSDLQVNGGLAEILRRWE